MDVDAWKEVGGTILRVCCTVTLLATIGYGFYWMLSYVHSHPQDVEPTKETKKTLIWIGCGAASFAALYAWKHSVKKRLLANDNALMGNKKKYSD